VTARAKNVVVIIADQLRADHLGFGGNSVVRTPHLDRLAAQGTVFREAYVANPVCMPNRATIATGRWPSVHGTRTNGIPLDADAMTFPRALRRAGYTTSAVGKLHFQTMGWPFEPHQLQEIRDRAPWLIDPDLSDAVVRRREDNWAKFEDYALHAKGEIELPRDYYGFDTVDLTTGHGDTVSGHYVAWAKERGVDPLVMGGRSGSPNAYAGWGEVFESAIPLSAHPTRYVTERAIDRLERMHAGGTPFLLYVSYPDPHHPFAPPREYFNRHSPGELDVPASFDDSHESSPEHIRRIVERRGEPDPDSTMTWAPTRDQFLAAYAAELGSIEMLDDSIGEILAALTRLGHDDDTAIVFTSDHGDLFGDHGLMLKHFVHYRSVTNVPLVVREPGGARVDDSRALVSSADIAPTILNLTGVQGYRGIQGRSLLPIADGSTTEHRGALVIEEDQPFGVPGLPGPVRMRTMRSHSARLTEYVDHGTAELYDLADDPLELNNLASDSGSGGLLASTRTTMLHEIIRLADTGIAPTDAA